MVERHQLSTHTKITSAQQFRRFVVCQVERFLVAFRSVVIVSIGQSLAQDSHREQNKLQRHPFGIDPNQTCVYYKRQLPSFLDLSHD